jgi:hypothetical protein
MSNLSAILQQNPMLFAAGVAVTAFLIGRLWHRVPRPEALRSTKVVTLEAANSLPANVRIRSRWASLSKIAKIGACVVAGIGGLVIISAFLAGVSPVALGLFAALIAVGLGAVAIAVTQS